MFRSLDFLYVPCADVDAEARDYVERLGAELVWKVRGMATVVACLQPAAEGPAILLSGHLEPGPPVLVYRVDDYASTVAQLRACGLQPHELGIPHGPCASFALAGGQRLAVYQLTRPGAAHHFDGRIDEPDSAG